MTYKVGTQLVFKKVMFCSNGKYTRRLIAVKG